MLSYKIDPSMYSVAYSSLVFYYNILRQYLHKFRIFIFNTNQMIQNQEGKYVDTKLTAAGGSCMLNESNGILISF